MRVIPILSQCLRLQTFGFNTNRCDHHGLETLRSPSSMGAYFPACGPQGSASQPPGGLLQEGLVVTWLVGLAEQKPPETM